MKKLLALFLGLCFLPTVASAQQFIPLLRWTSATGTNATTTSFFTSSASTTNLFGTNITGFGLASCSGTSALTFSGTRFGCGAQPQGTVTAIGVTTANGVSGSSSGGATPNLTITLGAITPSSVTSAGTGQFANLLSIGSSTLQNFTAANSTSTNSTTTAFAISSITSKLLKADGNGSIIGASAGTDYQAAGSYALQATTITVAGTANQITSSAAAQDLSANHTWTLSIPSTFHIGTASTTVLDVGNAYFGQTASSSFNGAGALFVVGSTTLQNFVAINGTTTNATSTNLNVSGLASTTSFRANTAIFGGSVGIGSSTPFSSLSLGTGSIVVAENKLSTSTSMTIDWNVGNQQLIQKGTAAITLTFSNVINGKKLTLVICNPNSGTGGTITWPTSPTLYWPAGTPPTQTTTANKCDLITFAGTQGTSTTASTIVLGGANVNY